MGRRQWQGSFALRLTIVATAATAVVLLLLLGGLYAVLSRQLDAAVDAGLRARFADLRSSLAAGDEAVLASELYAELHEGGQLRQSPALQGTAPLVDQAEVPPDALVTINREVQLRGRAQPRELRVLAGHTARGEVLALGASRQPQAEANERLLVGLLVAGPLLLLLVAGAVARTAHAALRPVDLLTRQAATISEGGDAAGGLTAVPGDDEVARLSRTLAAMLGRLSVAFARERAFVDDASHELRTPITVLRGELELALSDLDDRAGVEQSLRAAQGEAERLSRLAEDLLVLARQRAGALALQHDPVDVTDLLTRTAGRLRYGTRLDLQVDSPALVLAGDAGRLEQLLSNLVVNAAQAGASCVRLRARAEPGAVVLSVEDDGPGFPPGFAAVAFERFSRADVARTRASGAGLGLSLVAAIAQAAGGTVAAGTSQDLGGAQVTVRLPA